MRLGQILLIVGVAIVLVAGVVYFFGPGQELLAGKSTITDPKVIGKSAIGFVSLPYKDDYGMTRVAGYVDNQTGKKFAAVEIEMRLLDDKGNKRELVRYEVTDVAPKSRKTFDVNAGSIDGTRKAEIKIAKIEAVGK